MTVSLFDDQLVLEVPNNVNYICFKRIPEVIEFCLQFPYDRMDILTDSDSTYVTLSLLKNNIWYTTSSLTDHDTDHFDVTDALLPLIHQQQSLKAYEYW